MTVSDGITLAGTGVTLMGMAIAIWQAGSARKSSQDAQAAFDKVRLAGIADRLRSAQEHIRTLPPQSMNRRGAKIAVGIARIRQEFDSVLGALPKAGAGGKARTLVAAAQDSLNQYENSLGSQADQAAWQNLQRNVQDAISELTTAVSEHGFTT